MISAIALTTGGAMDCGLSIAQVVAPPTPNISPLVWAEILGDCTTMARAGLGHHDIVLDVETPLSELPAALAEVTAIVLAPDESITEYTAGPTILAAVSSDTDPQLYSADVSTALGPVPHTFFKLRHEFDQRGEHRIALRFEFGTAGEWVSTIDAVIVDVGDGLYGDF